MTTLEQAAREELGMPEGMAYNRRETDELNKLIKQYKGLLRYIAEHPSEEVLKAFNQDPALGDHTYTNGELSRSVSAYLMTIVEEK